MSKEEYNENKVEVPSSVIDEKPERSTENTYGEEYKDLPTFWRIVRHLFTRKTIDRMSGEDGGEENLLKRELSALDLTMVGIGAIIGTGLFVMAGLVAKTRAGPSVTVSFIIAGIASAFSALSYSEIACMIPVSGSAYTYAYSTLGEFFGWVIGWDLIVEYLFGAAGVSVGWSKYFVMFIKLCGGNIDERLIGPPIEFVEENGTQEFKHTGRILNLPGLVLPLAVTVVLVVGIRESKFVNNFFVGVKVCVALLFIFATAKFVDPQNWQPFIPPPVDNDWHKFGVSGIFAGAQVVFFAYIGFDMVTTAGQEAKNPQRDLPIGICLSLVICTALYIVMGVVMTGLKPYTQFDLAAPIISATPDHMNWLKIIVSLGASLGLVSVVLINMLSQSRVFYCMAHDGLLPTPFALIHPRFRTPYIPTILSGISVSLLGAFLPVDLLANMTSVGTLFAFFLVHLGVIVLRFTHPDSPRRFKIPGPGYTWMIFPIIGAGISLLLIVVAEPTTIYRVAIWLGIGILIYIFYGYHHSRLFNRKHDEYIRQLDQKVKRSN
ncbi:uncharacterized protein VTP21DRAFT_8878 [Calcarisporiella thermophila]|uniref:uncharacterized protein n=1 Tax=Calcarisporiella thermophila TaxID=911321 RepID=UPI003743B0BB